MSSYASDAKLSELTLDGDPLPPVDTPAVETEPPASNVRPDQPGPRTTHSEVVKASLLKLKDAPAEAMEVKAVEPGTRMPAEAGGRPAARSNTDEFLVAATRELESGELDQPLWAKAIELAGNDAEVAKPAYLRARATALRIEKQKKRAEMQAQRTRELALEEKQWAAARPKPAPPSRRLLLMGAAAGIAVLVAIAFFALRRDSDVAKTPAAASAPATPRGATKALPAKPAGPERAAPSGEDFAKKIAELKAAGNWNVLVLYAVEWTRKLPDSADAWNELGMGYAKLRQYSEAVDAATKAAQLAPSNAQVWQTLGDVNVALERPVPALSAYEHAVALNSRDITSLVQLGSLHAQFGHLPEARQAFAQALDVSPTDVDALCGATSIAQKEGRAKDAENFARQIKAADLRCREPAAAAPPTPSPAPAPAANPAVRKKPGAPATR